MDNQQVQKYYYNFDDGKKRPTLSFIIKGKDFGTPYDEITIHESINYKLVVSINIDKASCTLTSFDILHT